MRTVSYADEHFRTTDAVAHAVLRYAQLLAHGDSSDIIRIPVIVDEDQTWAEIIIGPASQITTLEVPSNDADAHLDDEEVVADINKRSDDVERARAIPKPEPEPEDAKAALPDVETDFDFPEV
jgi:hypothetical protein